MNGHMILLIIYIGVPIAAGIISGVIVLRDYIKFLKRIKKLNSED